MVFFKKAVVSRSIPVTRINAVDIATKMGSLTIKANSPVETIIERITATTDEKTFT